MDDDTGEAAQFGAGGLSGLGGPPLIAPDRGGEHRSLLRRVFPKRDVTRKPVQKAPGDPRQVDWGWGPNHYGPVHHPPEAEERIYSPGLRFVRAFLTGEERERMDVVGYGIYFRDMPSDMDPRTRPAAGHERYDRTSPPGDAPWHPPADGGWFEDWPSGPAFVVRLAMQPFVWLLKNALGA